MAIFKEKFDVGDLVILNTSFPSVLKNQLGIIIQIGVNTVYQLEENIQENWYVAQFGSIRLIVSVDMIIKVETKK